MNHFLTLGCWSVPHFLSFIINYRSMHVYIYIYIPINMYIYIYIYIYIVNNLILVPDIVTIGSHVQWSSRKSHGMQWTTHSFSPYWTAWANVQLASSLVLYYTMIWPGSHLHIYSWSRYGNVSTNSVKCYDWQKPSHLQDDFVYIHVYVYIYILIDCNYHCYIYIYSIWCGTNNNSPSPKSK